MMKPWLTLSDRELDRMGPTEREAYEAWMRGYALPYRREMACWEPDQDPPTSQPDRLAVLMAAASLTTAVGIVLAVLFLK